MRPDTFTELIRRKLESIRPDATERDWTRMQRSLQQAGLSAPSGAPVAGGAAPGWLLTAAGLGTAALLAVTVWQRSEINTLREKLTQQTIPTATAPAPNALSNLETSVPAPPQPDTVYITRYRPVESASRPQASGESRSAPSGPVGVVTDAAPASLRLEDQARATDTALQTPAVGATDTPVGPVENALPAQTAPDAGLPGNSSVVRQPRLDGTKVAATVETSNAPSLNSPGQRTARPSTTQQTGPAPLLIERDGGLPRPPETTLGTGNVAASPSAAPALRIEALAQSRLLLTRPVNWSARLARRLPRPTAAPIATGQPESPSQSRIQPVTVFRAGVGSDLRAGYWNTGLEVGTVLGARWVLSAGLVRSVSSLGTFVTDDEYDYRTRRNFRREFAPGFDQKREIYGIDVRSIRYQIPVSLGYRIPVGRSLALLPSVGAYLDLSNKAQVAFSYRTPLPRPGYETALFEGKGPVHLLNGYTAGAALEWQQNHWVVQGGLLFTRPRYTDLTGTAAPSLGGRVRLLYQF